MIQTGVLALFATAGCALYSASSKPDSGGGVQDGFQVAAVISAVVERTNPMTGVTEGSAFILLASTPDVCADWGASPLVERKNQRTIDIILRDVNGSATTAPTGPGTYTIYSTTGSQPTNEAIVGTGGTDATCQALAADSATAQTGTVTLHSVSGNVFSGSYDVVLSNGSEITGNFAPVACPALATGGACICTPACE